MSIQKTIFTTIGKFISIRTPRYSNHVKFCKKIGQLNHPRTKSDFPKYCFTPGYNTIADIIDYLC